MGPDRAAPQRRPKDRAPGDHLMPRIKSTSTNSIRSPRPASAIKLARSFIALLQKDDAATNSTGRSTASYQPALVMDLETPVGKPKAKPSSMLPVDLVLAAIRVAAAVAPHPKLLQDLRAGAPRVLLLETGDATLISEIYTVAAVCLLPDRTLLSPSLLESKPRRAPEENCAVVFKIGGSDRRSTDIDRIAATALSLGGPIVAITPERRLLPDDLVRASDATLTLPALDAASVSFMIETSAGHPPVREVEEALARRVEISDFRVALRGKRSADEFLAQLECVVRSRLAVETYRPSLEELHGYGRAKTVGLEIAADLKSYARAELQWDAIDRGLLLAGPPALEKRSTRKRSRTAPACR